MVQILDDAREAGADGLGIPRGSCGRSCTVFHDLGIFKDTIFRTFDRYEHKRTDPVPSERISALWRIPGGNSVRQHEAEGHQAAAETGGFCAEPAV